MQPIDLPLLPVPSSNGNQMRTTRNIAFNLETVPEAPLPPLVIFTKLNFIRNHILSFLFTSASKVPQIIGVVLLSTIVIAAASATTAVVLLRTDG